MKIINQYHEVITEKDVILHQCTIMERAGRVCYKSEDRIHSNDRKPSYEEFLKGIITRGHESVLEHSAVSVLFVTSRAMSHQLVRHRLCAISQESMRFCNYTKDKFLDGVVFINPFSHKINYTHNTSLEVAECMWKERMRSSENNYNQMISEYGLPAEEARGLLPHDTKTEIVITANIRQWRHIFNMRCGGHAQPQMKALMKPVLEDLYNVTPFLFEDIYNKYIAQ